MCSTVNYASLLQYSIFGTVYFRDSATGTDSQVCAALAIHPASCQHPHHSYSILHLVSSFTVLLYLKIKVKVCVKKNRETVLHVYKVIIISKLLDPKLF